MRFEIEIGRQKKKKTQLNNFEQDDDDVKVKIFSTQKT